MVDMGAIRPPTLFLNLGHVDRGAVAIGECGLDSHYDHAPPHLQRRAFAAQLALARELGRPVVVHTREAVDDTAAMVREAGREGVRGVLHCFTGPASLAEVAIEAGWYLSFSGVVTFRKWDGDDLIRLVPPDRILVETDAPYLAPVPHRGKRNEPAYCTLTLAHVAAARGASAGEMGQLTVANATRFFGLDHVGSLLRPPALLEPRDKRERGEIDDAQLRAVEDRCIRDVVKMQEDIGLQAVTDGEYRRKLWNVDFVRKFDGVVVKEGLAEESGKSFQGGDANLQRSPTRFAVTGKLKRVREHEVENFKFTQSVTNVPAKLSIPSPSVLHFRGGRGGVSAAAYPEMDKFFTDLARVYREEIQALAAAGCTYLQIDDTNLAYLCDPKMREGAKKIGEDPDRLPSLYASCRLRLKMASLYSRSASPTWRRMDPGAGVHASPDGPNTLGMGVYRMNSTKMIIFEELGEIALGYSQLGSEFSSRLAAASLVAGKLADRFSGNG